MAQWLGALAFAPSEQVSQFNLVDVLTRSELQRGSMQMCRFPVHAQEWSRRARLSRRDFQTDKNCTGELLQSAARGSDASTSWTMT